MTFERTKSGLENLAKFYNVDFVCYVEGGGGHSDRSQDVTFWKKVLSKLLPKLKIRCLARGGKHRLKSLARNVVDNGIRSTLVAMDGDYDELTSRKIVDRRVLYTYGYSWENDVLSKNVLVHILADSMGADILSPDETSFLHSKYDDLAKNLIWPVRADYYAHVAMTSVLPRDKPGRVVSVDPKTSVPLIERGKVIELCAANNKSKRPRTLPKLPILADSMRFCVGKFYAYLILCLLNSVHMKFKRSKKFSQTDDLNFVAILQFPDVVLSESDTPITIHYKSITDAIKVLALSEEGLSAELL